MTTRAVPLLAVGIAGLLLASAVGAVVVSRQDDDQVTTGTSTSTSFPPFEESTTSSSVVEEVPTVVTEVPAPPASLTPVAPAASTTSSTAKPAATPTPVLAVDPAPCAVPAAQPAAAAPAGPLGVFTVAVGTGAVSLVSTAGRLPAWRPKTSQVVSLAVAAGKPAALCLSGPEGAGAKRLTTPAGVGRPALSFDGGRLAVRSARPGGVDLVVSSVEGADQKVVLQSNEIGDPVWLGDGSAVVACAVTGGARRLVSVPAGGGDPKVLRDACPPSPVASSPDGGRIAFSLGDQVVVLDVKTRLATSLKLGTAATGAAPSWSPDGRKVAFGYSDAQGPALGVLDLDRRQGLAPYRAAGLTAPVWAPAGDLIAFVGTDGTGSASFVIKADGSGPRLVARCSSRCALAAQPWAPDSSRFALELFGAPA